MTSNQNPARASDAPASETHDDHHAKARIMVTLFTHDGRTGHGPLNSPLDWEGPSDGDGHTTLAVLEYEHPTRGAERVKLSVDAWREFDSSVAFNLLEKAVELSALEAAIREQLDEIEARYCCCGGTWTDTWPSACNSECNDCGADVSPNATRQVTGLGTPDEEGILDILADSFEDEFVDTFDTSTLDGAFRALSNQREFDPENAVDFLLEFIGRAGHATAFIAYAHRCNLADKSGEDPPAYVPEDAS